MGDYVFDVYLDVAPAHKVWLLDLNPWIPFAIDSLMFEWEELENWKIGQEVCLKIVEDKQHI